MKRALLFDLDDTLVPEFAYYRAAFAASYVALATGKEVTADELWEQVVAAARP